MRIFGVALSFLVLFGIQPIVSQQLLINEVSQGTSSKEYVELIVAGNPTCQTPVPCMDLRGVLLDDNNGYFAAGGGSGIAPGAIRFSNDVFWSCIPQGTLIVVYNNLDINPALPANDNSMSDGNCRLILPVNSNLFEGQSAGPTNTDPSYPPAGSWIVGGATWAQVGMSNTNDSFQVRSNITDATPNFSVSWGNNTVGAQIYFSTATGAVFSFMNTTNNNSLTQSNWTQGAVGTDETPGIPNSTQNAAWIASMNPNCGVAVNPLQVTFATTNASCGGVCNGALTAQPTGGNAPYQFAWSNGATTATITNLCPGNYTVTVTDAGGCSTTGQATVQAGGGLNIITIESNETCLNACDGGTVANASGGAAPYGYLWSNGIQSSNNPNLCPGTYTVTVVDQNGCTGTAQAVVQAGNTPPDATISTTGPFTTTDTPVTFTASSNGGLWTADCGSCISATGNFDPSQVMAGSYEICYTVGTTNCNATDCQTIMVTQGCVGQTITFNESICPNSTIDFNGQTFSDAGSYSVQFTDMNGCDSTLLLNLSIFNTQDINQTKYLCPGDSIEIFGVWVYEPDLFEQEVTDNNGCVVNHQITVIQDDCNFNDFTIFVPNTFTPNNDNVNDVFQIILDGALLEEGFIVNRWGTIIHTFSETITTWDGRTTSGELVQDGVYTYVLFYTPASTGLREKTHGFVTVVR